MVTSEEVFAFVEQDGVASGVAGLRNNEEIVVDSEGFGAFGLNFDGASIGGDVLGVENAIAPEPLVKLFMVCHIIPMR